MQTYMPDRAVALSATAGAATFPYEGATAEPKWYGVYTLPHNEKSLLMHLQVRQVEAFLPTWESMRQWKNRQRVKVVQPLFPSYLFVRIRASERTKVLQSPGALRIMGNCLGPLPISDAEIDFLRSDFCRQRIEPFRDMVIGTKVRIKSGLMQGLQGTLVEKRSGLRFVLTIEMIHQNAAIEVAAEEIEPLPDEPFPTPTAHPRFVAT